VAVVADGLNYQVREFLFAAYEAAIAYIKHLLTFPKTVFDLKSLAFLSQRTNFRFF
jgi:hypothetical protein